MPRSKSKPAAPGSDAELFMLFMSSKMGNESMVIKTFHAWYISMIPESYTEKGRYFNGKRLAYIRRTFKKNDLPDEWMEQLERKIFERRDESNSPVDKSEVVKMEVQNAVLRKHLEAMEKNYSEIIQRLDKIESKL